MAVRQGRLYGSDGCMAGTVVRQIWERHGRALQGVPGWHEGWAEQACSTASPVISLGVSCETACLLHTKDSKEDKTRSVCSKHRDCLATQTSRSLQPLA